MLLFLFNTMDARYPFSTVKIVKMGMTYNFSPGKNKVNLQLFASTAQ